VVVSDAASIDRGPELEARDLSGDGYTNARSGAIVTREGDFFS